jgi:hypothetical protein
MLFSTVETCSSGEGPILSACFYSEHNPARYQRAEFCGQKWIGYLIENNIKPRIRIKANTQINRKLRWRRTRQKLFPEFTD